MAGASLKYRQAFQVVHDVLIREWDPIGVRDEPMAQDEYDSYILQQARNATMWLEDEGLEMKFLLRDRDTKYSAALDRLIESEEATTIRSPYRSPIANCYAESWIGSLKRECLNHFLCFGLKHFDHIVQAYANYYNHLRPHQGLDNRVLGSDADPIPIRPPTEVGPVKRLSILGGLLNHYERKAA